MNARCFLLSAIAAAGVLLGLAGPVRADEIVIRDGSKEQILHGTILSENNQEVQVNLEGTAIRIPREKIVRIVRQSQEVKPTDSKTAKIYTISPGANEETIVSVASEAMANRDFEDAERILLDGLRLQPKSLPMRKKMVLLYANAGNDIATRRKAVQAQADLIVYCPEQYEAVRGELLNASGQLAAQLLLSSEPGRETEIENLVRLATTLMGSALETSLPTPEWRSRWYPAFARMRTDYGKGVVARDDPEYLPITAALMINIERQGEKALASFKFLHDKMLQIDPKDFAAYAMRGNPKHWPLIGLYAASRLGRRTMERAEARQFDTALEDCLVMNCLAREANWEALSKDPYSGITLRENSAAAAAYETSMARAVRMEALRKFTAGMNGANAGLFRDYILFRTFEADPNLPGPRLEIASRAKSALETYKKRMEAFENPQAIQSEMATLAGMFPAQLWNDAALAQAFKALDAQLKREMQAEAELVRWTKQLSAPATKEQMKNLYESISAAIAQMEGTIRQTRLRDLAAQLKARIESVEQAERQKAEEEKRRAAEEARRAAEEGIRAVVNNYVQAKQEYDSLIKFWDPQSQNPPQTIGKLHSHQIREVRIEDDANASVAVYLDFENAQGTTFQGDFTIHVVRRGDSWYVRELTQ